MSTPKETETRRRFVAMLPGLLLGVTGAMRWSPDGHGAGCASAAHRRGHATRQAGHPEPRPGIDGSRVLKKAQLRDNPDAGPVFDMVRRIPQVADGIRCHCGCADDPSHRSLLTCYEGDGMAQHCEICQGQGKLAFKLHEAGKSLAEIRAAIDKEYA